MAQLIPIFLFFISPLFFYGSASSDPLTTKDLVLEKESNSMGERGKVWYICSLITKQTPLTEGMIEQLAVIGIDLTFNAPPPPQEFKFEVPIENERGVIFLTDFNEKAEVFQKWLDLVPFKPQKIVNLEKKE